MFESCRVHQQDQITCGQSEKAARLVYVSIVCHGRDSTIQYAFKLSRCFDANGAIADCMEQLAKPGGVRILVDQGTHKLLFAEREIPTAASNALSALRSPSGNWVAVLSATGPIIPPFTLLNGDRVLGARYHEVKSVPDAVSAGKSIQIPVVNTITTQQLCWSPDEKFVVYSDGSFSTLVVVETNLDSRNHSNVN